MTFYIENQYNNFVHTLEVYYAITVMKATGLTPLLEHVQEDSNEFVSKDNASW